MIGQAVTILERPENVMKAQFGVYYEDNVPQSGYLERYNQDVDQYDNENDLSFNAQNAKIVYEALIKDISEGNYEDAIRFQMSTDNSGYMSDQIYINAIGLQFYNKNGSYFPDDQIREEYYSDSYNERYSSQSCSAYLTIGKKCKHTIAALKEIGALSGCRLYRIENEEKSCRIGRLFSCPFMAHREPGWEKGFTTGKRYCKIKRSGITRFILMKRN